MLKQCSWFLQPHHPSVHTQRPTRMFLSFRWLSCSSWSPPYISEICSILTCWALFRLRCLQGFYHTPVCSTGCPHWWFLLLSLPPGGWRAAAQNIKKKKNRKAGLSSNAKTSVGAFMVSHMEPGYFAHVSAFPQRCPHIICVQPCHLHRSVCTHTYKKKKKNYIHISMLSWVCERQMGVNWKRV